MKYYSIIKDKIVPFCSCKSCGKSMVTVDTDAGVSYLKNCNCTNKKGE